ncbi:MAG: Crp/Fnr family transcriptional regulator [Pseudomonadota bacterium]
MFREITDIFDKGRRVDLEPGQTIFRTGDPVHSMYCVVSGELDLVRHTRTGMPLILNRAGCGVVLAEASAYSQAYHCDCVARQDSSLRFLSTFEFHDVLRSSPDLAGLWAAQLAASLQKARMLSEIRALKTVSERLDAWLTDNGGLPPKGQIQHIAHMLGVSREALYRELAKRRA